MLRDVQTWRTVGSTNAAVSIHCTGPVLWAVRATPVGYQEILFSGPKRGESMKKSALLAVLMIATIPAVGLAQEEKAEAPAPTQAPTPEI